jgi:hypothetical protein
MRLRYARPRCLSSMLEAVLGEENGTVGWARTTDLRIHNPAL